MTKALLSAVPQNKVMGSWWMAPKPWSPSDSGKYILLLILPISLPGEPQISRARHGTDRGNRGALNWERRDLKALVSLHHTLFVE